MTLVIPCWQVLNDAPDAWALIIMAANWTLKISSALEAIVYSMIFLLVLIEMVLKCIATSCYIQECCIDSHPETVAIYS